MDVAFHGFPNAEHNPALLLVAWELGVVGDRDDDMGRW
jgi:hypothetical protein